MEISIPIAALAAAAPFMATRDIRYYLNGVKVEAREGFVYCIATDGHTLAVAKHECTDNDEAAEFILKREDVAAILKNIAAEDALRVTLKEHANIEIQFGGHHIITTRVEGQFPNWQSAAQVPGGERGQNLCLSSRFLRRVDDSIKSAKKHGAFTKYAGVHVETNGTHKPMTLLARGENIEVGFVLMPLRDDAIHQHSDAGLLAPIVGPAPKPEENNP
jgi:hypothetical protein